MNRAHIDMMRLMLSTRGECAVRVGGWCMQPAIRNGADVTIVATAPGDLTTGDMVAYLREGRLLVHRIAGRNPGGFLMRADSGRPCEHAIAENEIVGRVRFVRNPSMPHRVIRRIKKLLYRKAA